MSQKISVKDPSKSNLNNNDKFNQFDPKKYNILKKVDQLRVKNHKLDEINSENKRILVNLLRIQRSKTTSKLSKDVCKPKMEKKIQGVNSVANQQKLNQIESENMILSERIMQQKSDFARNKLKKQEKEYFKLKKHMQKVKLPNVSILRSRALSSNLGNGQQKIRKIPDKYSEEEYNNDYFQEKQQEEELQKIQQNIFSQYQKDKQSNNNSLNSINNNNIRNNSSQKLQKRNSSTNYIPKQNKQQLLTSTSILQESEIIEQNPYEQEENDKLKKLQDLLLQQYQKEKDNSIHNMNQSKMSISTQISHQKPNYQQKNKQRIQEIQKKFTLRQSGHNSSNLNKSLKHDLNKSSNKKPQENQQESEENEQNQMNALQEKLMHEYHLQRSRNQFYKPQK